MPCGVWWTSGWNCTAYHIPGRRFEFLAPRRGASSPSTRSLEAVPAPRRRATSRRPAFARQALKQQRIRQTISTSGCGRTRACRPDAPVAQRMHHELQSDSRCRARAGPAQTRARRPAARLCHRRTTAPPESTMPAGEYLRSSSSFAVHGSTTENTFCLRMRRAISCVYCAPKSRMTML